MLKTIVAIAAALTIVPISATGAGSYCTAFQIRTGTCSATAPAATNTGAGVDIGATVDLGNDNQATPDSGHTPIGSYAPPTGPAPYVPPPDESDAPIVCLDDTNTVVGTECAIDVPEPEETDPEPEEPVAPPEVVTITDLASFVPTPPSVATEPDGVGAKNMPLNSISRSSAQTIGGELFGFPVAVTFTPAGFRQDWGDGAVTESGHGGAAWQTLGQAEFSPTDTSHAYAEKGTYTLTVTALYTAVVDFGEWGTRTVEGVISAPAAARDIRIVEVHTALVQQDCIEDPSGAGCS
ncbi:hypothetical protein [Microbacterium rhizophilus]|uniref:hypothetical protein n=1 Tax=Microbacterium rhizophilus TaxID=3138934 RepID=UPI0031F0529A